MKRVLAVLFALPPFALAAVAAMQRSDFRHSGMVLASFTMSAIVVGIGTSRVHTTSGATFVAFATFVLTACAAAFTAYQFGAKAAFGIWALSCVFAIFWAASAFFFVVSHIERTHERVQAH